MANSLYAIDSFDPYQKESGLIKTLSKYKENVDFLILNDSVLPLVSNVPVEITQEQANKVGATIDTILSILISNKSLISPRMLEFFKEKVEFENKKSSNINVKKLNDWYERALTKLNTITPYRLKRGDEEIYSIFSEAIFYVEKELDLRSKENISTANRNIENLSFLATLGVLMNNKQFTSLTTNKFDIDLFDSLFGITYTQAIDIQEIENLNKVKNMIFNPKIKIAACDLNEANQPFDIIRNTQEKQSLPKKWYSINSYKQKEILLNLRKYFANINLLLKGSSIGKRDSILERKIENIESKEKFLEKIGEKPRLEQLIDENTTIIKEVPKEIKQGKLPDKQIEITQQKIEIKPEQAKLDLPKSNGNLTKDNLTSLYEDVKIKKEELPDIYSKGLLQRKIKIYNFLKQISEELGLKEVTKYVSDDLTSIRTYLKGSKSEEVISLKNKFEAESKNLEGCLNLLDDNVIAKEQKPLIEILKNSQTITEEIKELYTQPKVNSKKPKITIGEKVKIIEENIMFLLKRTPFENEELPKDIYRSASGLSPSSFTKAMKRAQEQGLINTDDYSFEKSSDYLSYKNKICIALATIVKRITPEKLITLYETKQSKKSEKRKFNQNFDAQKAIGIRNKLGLFQRQLGEKLNIKQAEISKYESGNFSSEKLGEKGKVYLNFLKENGYNPFNL